jgi:chromosome segregation ATPase
MSDQAPETASTPTDASAGAAETAQQDSQSNVDWEAKLKQTSTQSFAAGRREAQEALEAAQARIRELEQSTQAKQEAESSADDLRKKLAEERKQRESLEAFRADRLERDKAKLKARAEELPDRLRQSIDRALERDDTDTADDLIEAYTESLPKPDEKPAPKSPQGKPAANDGPAMSIGKIMDGMKAGDMKPFNAALKAGVSKSVLYKAMQKVRR